MNENGACLATGAAGGASTFGGAGALNAHREVERRLFRWYRRGSFGGLRLWRSGLARGPSRPSPGRPRPARGLRP